MKKTLALTILVFLAVNSVYGQDVPNLFRKWDFNNNGFLSYSEFPGDRGYFNQIDTDKDRQISKSEFYYFMGYQEPAKPEPIDPPKSGKVKRLQQKLKNKEQKIQAMQKENKRLQNALKQLQKDNGTLQQKNRRLTNQVQNLTRKNKQLSDLLAGMRGKPNMPPVTPHRPPVTRPPVVKPIEKPLPSIEIPGPAAHFAQTWLKAEEGARVEALRNLAMTIRGSWIVSCSKNIDARNQLIIISKLEPTNLVGVVQLESDFDFVNSVVTVPVEISRANIIESIHRANPKMTAENYQELRFMFPEKVKSIGRGVWTPKAQKRIMALYGAQMDARRKLVEQLRGVMVRSSSRMENFVVTKDVVVVSIENTLLIGVKKVDEKVIRGSVAQVTIEITRPMFIYSIRRGMEAHGQKLTPAEYQNMRNMLSKMKYQFVGKAAIE